MKFRTKEIVGKGFFSQVKLRPWSFWKTISRNIRTQNRFILRKASFEKCPFRTEEEAVENIHSFNHWYITMKAPKPKYDVSYKRREI